MSSVFAAKFLNIHLLILVFLIANHLFMFVSAVAVHFIDASLNLLYQPLNVYSLLVNSVNTYVAILAICAVQFWIGLRFKNFIVPIAIGFSLWFIGAMMVLEFHSSYANYFPYSFHIFSIFLKYKPQLPAVQLGSVGYAALFLLIGFIDFKRRRMTS